MSLQAAVGQTHIRDTLGVSSDGFLANPLEPRWRQAPAEMVPGLPSAAPNERGTVFVMICAAAVLLLVLYRYN